MLQVQMACVCEYQNMLGTCRIKQYRGIGALRHYRPVLRGYSYDSGVLCSTLTCFGFVLQYERYCVRVQGTSVLSLISKILINRIHTDRPILYQSFIWANKSKALEKLRVDT